MSGKGSITLVGAGPGHGGLFTLAGAAALASAQVVLYDRLVGPEILARVPTDAQAIDVGKAANNHTLPQEEINRLLVSHALEGKRVVRLKGGDPFLFGRGGEERQAAEAAGVSCRVIPGISAALAVPAWAGIPVTHRNASSSVHIFTGHAKGGGPELDYRTMARLEGTLVFLMGVNALEEICRGLVEAGKDSRCPAAIIQQGTLPQQRELFGTLETLADLARREGIGSPALTVVGEVCLYGGQPPPLSEKRVLVTRPLWESDPLVEGLEARGCRVLRFPCIELRPNREPEALGILGQLSHYRWIAFTSAYGVKLFFQTMKKKGLDLRGLSGLKFAVVGPGTARELERHGIYADLMPRVYDGTHLARELVEELSPGQRVLLYRAEEGRRELGDILTHSQVPFTDLPAYKTAHIIPHAPGIRELLQEGKVDLLTFTSPSAVKGFAGAMGKDFPYKAFTALCMGEATAKQAARLGCAVEISPEATLNSMANRAAELLWSDTDNHPGKDG